jgi:hypothetical protein
MDQLILMVIFIIWLFVLSYFVYQIRSKIYKLTFQGQKDNILGIIDKIISQQKSSEKEIELIKTSVKGLVEINSLHVQKIGLIRYNPFDETGGDQSFVLSILDGQNNGIVLTSLYNRGVTRWYAKSVKNGKGEDHKLSGEEEAAIKHAHKLYNQKIGS